MQNDADGLPIQMIARVLMIGVWWGVAWGASWLAGLASATAAQIVFWGIGALGTVAGVQGIIREIRFRRHRNISN